jgi:hypothetical protein
VEMGSVYTRQHILSASLRGHYKAFPGMRIGYGLQVPHSDTKSGRHIVAAMKRSEMATGNSSAINLR